MVNEYLLIALLSMTPFIEGRGAIAFAAVSNINLWVAFPLAVLGNLIVIPITFRLLKLAHFSKSVYYVFGKRFENKIQKYSHRFETWEEFALLIFVAVPIPVTGAFTAIAIADILGLKQRKSSLVIGLGVLSSSVIALLLSLGIVSLI